MLQIAHLLKLADEYERIEGVGDTTLSSRIFADSKKLGALRAEADITTGRFNTAIEWFARNWPAKAKWPADVQRPKVAA